MRSSFSHLACLCSQCSLFLKIHVHYYHHGFFIWSDWFDKLNQRQPEQVVHVQQSHSQAQRKLTLHRYGEMFPPRGKELQRLPNAYFDIIWHQGDQSPRCLRQEPKYATQQTSCFLFISKNILLTSYVLFLCCHVLFPSNLPSFYFFKIGTLLRFLRQQLKEKRE